MDTSNEIILSFHNTLLRRCDVELLKRPHWLNDQIISFYLEYLEKIVYKEQTNILFVSPDVVQCLKFFSPDERNIILEPLNVIDKELIFFPLNDNNDVTAGGNHWSLIVFSRGERTFFYYDSINGDSLKLYKSFVSDLAQTVNGNPFKFQRGDCLKQSNGYDCGIHVLCNVDSLVKRYLEFGSIDVCNVTIEEIWHKRIKIFEIIKALGGKI